MKRGLTRGQLGTELQTIGLEIESESLYVRGNGFKDQPLGAIGLVGFGVQSSVYLGEYLGLKTQAFTILDKTLDPNLLYILRADADPAKIMLRKLARDFRAGNNGLARIVCSGFVLTQDGEMCDAPLPSEVQTSTNRQRDLHFVEHARRVAGQVNDTTGRAGNGWFFCHED